MKNFYKLLALGGLGGAGGDAGGDAGGGAKMAYGTLTPAADANVLTDDASTSYVLQHGLGEVPTVFILWTASTGWKNSLNLYVYNHKMDVGKEGEYRTMVYAGYHTSAGGYIDRANTSMHVGGYGNAFIANREEISLTNANTSDNEVYIRSGVTYYWVALKMEV